MHNKLACPFLAVHSSVPSPAYACVLRCKHAIVVVIAVMTIVACSSVCALNGAPLYRAAIVERTDATCGTEGWETQFSLLSFNR